ncbi:hypothetical protein ACFHW2_11855 [Actinomadura sp. LOL_016]|uniref:hypothetical protein n=1 Tax=unclassified Actinomadura TaxID=2626254 RepID=UPI003A80AAD1
MTPEIYWIGKTVVIEWRLTGLDGAAVTDATVVGTITLPDETTTAATVSHQAGTGVYRASYEATMPGRHAYRLEATGSVETAEEGAFDVRPHPSVGPAPTLDPGTDIGKVRVLIPDLDPDRLLLGDAEITAYLGMARGTGTPRIMRAAALALDAIASSEALVSKKLRDKDLATDGPAVAKELRERAAGLRGQADDEEDNDLADGGGLEIVDYVEPWSRAWGPENTEPEV